MQMNYDIFDDRCSSNRISTHTRCVKWNKNPKHEEWKEHLWYYCIMDVKGEKKKNYNFFRWYTNCHETIKKMSLSRFFLHLRATKILSHVLLAFILSANTPFYMHFGMLSQVTQSSSNGAQVDHKNNLMWRASFPSHHN